MNNDTKAQHWLSIAYDVSRQDILDAIYSKSYGAINTPNHGLIDSIAYSALVEQIGNKALPENVEVFVTLTNDTDKTIAKTLCRSSGNVVETIKKAAKLIDVYTPDKTYIATLCFDDGKTIASKLHIDPALILPTYLKTLGAIEPDAFIVTILSNKPERIASLVTKYIAFDSVINVKPTDMKLATPAELYSNGNKRLAIIVQHLIACRVLDNAKTRMNIPSLNIIERLEILSCGVVTIDDVMPDEWRVTDWKQLGEHNARANETFLASMLAAFIPDVLSVENDLYRRITDYMTIWTRACDENDRPIYSDVLLYNAETTMNDIATSCGVKELIEAHEAGVPISDLFPKQ